ncbi:hypothetical protein PRZ48_008986 [Zasmidium cellare]|uniref:F-box domain-containing protein n=1 Tax=Zasmidium cellare TaxID=395010 RepID=A0ABR0EH08_ZASCE|nr:hypothetical protein PRZ48_008986 [Zasmidium cellare]
MSAAEKTFGVAELFEAIASQLPACDLLSSRSVCRQWRVNIDGSKPILRKLFLLPAQDDYVTSVDNGLGLEWKSGSIEPQYGLRGMPQEGYDDTGPKLHNLNETLFRRSPDTSKEHWEITQNRGWRVKIHQGRISNILDFLFDPMSLRGYHNAFEMYLTQPPVKQVDLFAMVDMPADKTAKHTRSWTIRNEEGVKANHVKQHLEIQMLKMQCAQRGGRGKDMKGRVLWKESWLHIPGHVVLTKEDMETMMGVEAGEGEDQEGLGDLK